MAEHFYIAGDFFYSAPFASLRSLDPPWRVSLGVSLFNVLCGWSSRNDVEHIPAACAVGVGTIWAPKKKVVQSIQDLVDCGLLWPFTHGYLFCPLLVRFTPPEEELPAAPPPLRVVPPKEGFVYFVQAGGPEGQIKIGFATNVAVRIAALQTGCPSPLAVLCQIPGTYESERQYHERFAPDRRQGEWFHPSDELLAFIDGARRDGYR